jgi:uncharacterized protein (TIGR02145 family)
MKNLILIAFIFSFIFTSFDSPKGVKIGNQIWMTENLNVGKFRNGDPILHAKTKEEWKRAGKERKAAWCHYGNDPANGEKYGKLYNWYAVNDPRGLAPEGWHIPNSEEWSILIENLGSENLSAIKMKSNNEWKDSGWKENIEFTNESGFSALPGGSRAYDGEFDNIGLKSFWWSTEELTPNIAWRQFIYYKVDYLIKSKARKEQGSSVRCLQN